MPYREVTAKIDFDAVIAAARSASVNWSETLKQIETPYG
jgi:hypothetical protein